MTHLNNSAFKASAIAEVFAKAKNGSVIQSIVKTHAKSSISHDYAKKLAEEKARIKAIRQLKQQRKLVNNIIDQTIGNMSMKTFCLCVKDEDSNMIPMLAGTPSNGYTPSQIKSVYNVPTLRPASGIRKVSITIVIAYHYKNLQLDFNKFCNLNGLPSYTLQVVNLGSATNFNSGWAQEECLDIQWAYAMNTNANIRVIEAKSASYADIFSAIKYASNSANGITDIISMSFGGLEFSSQKIYDTYFTNKSICYLAASGDSNSVSYPATSPNVLACGGTSLNCNSPSYNMRSSETTWTLAGCGTSTVYLKPSYQSLSKNLNAYKNRTIPDISADANPSTGVQIIYAGKSYRIGGTSVSTPLIAGMLSIAIQKRLNNKYSAITTAYTVTNTNLVQKILYNPKLYSTNFYDITRGKDGIYTAGSGVDVATGLGAPNCNTLCSNISVQPTF
jgi:subtilase family serine protease